MTEQPHDLHDLFLAPVALTLNRQLADFEGLTGEEVEYRVALGTNRQPRNAGERAQLVLQAVTHLVDLHGWSTDLVSRGLRLRRQDHELVLGLPESLQTYVDNG